MRTGCLLVLVAGCGFRGADAPVDSDSGPPPPDACVSFSRELDACQLARASDLSLTGTVRYDTERHQLTVDDVAMAVLTQVVTTAHGDVDALLVHDLRLTPTTALRATGALPFAIVASGAIVVEDDAGIDVSDGGAGARAACPSGATTGQASTDGAGGGGGGGFAGNGGEGGKGNSDSGGVKDGGGRGPAETPATFVGGCPGAPGGKGDVDGGAGGNAGGAVYLVAARSITLGARASINAGGGGGGGGGHSPNRGDAGGGGGGAGGMIVLEAPVVIATQGAIAANGGGGGEGSAEEAGGNPGLAATTSADRAQGGHDGVSNGGDGGAGGSSDNADGGPGLGPRPGGGGGGGGGVGVIRIIAASPQLGVVSPPPGGA